MILFFKRTLRFDEVALTFIVLLVANYASAQQDIQSRTDWGQYFDKYAAEGTMVIIDGRESPAVGYAFNVSRANQRFSPASTYKIPHTLFALDAGLVADEFQVFKWDGVERSYGPHNQDQNLRSAIRNSALWVFEIFASEMGEEKAKTYLSKINYGNEDPSTEAGAYWVEGNLAISAIEQVAFLQRLYRNELPFQIEHQQLLKDMLINRAEKDWILRAKTGWQGPNGWWVGWVERIEEPVFFCAKHRHPQRHGRCLQTGSYRKRDSPVYQGLAAGLIKGDGGIYF
jgi:beta-lactamase class D